ncbi:MAG TPA: hypothetical protein VFL88_06025 [Gemmatimonadales bacterium]|jgi:hypothetical protein|nr:hypothetical protein [Gemmatimonadales bacterium]
MLSRSAPFALLAVLFLPVTSSAPITLKYKVSQHFSQTIDLTAMGGETQSGAADYDVYVTINSQDSAGGHAVAVKVDSLIPAAGADPQVAATLTAQMKDAAGSGFVDAKGKVSGFPADPKGGALRQLMQAVYPAVKKGARPGDTWSDTAAVTDSMMGGAVSRNVVTNYTASAGDKWKGESTLKLVAATSYTVSGTQSGVAVEGNGRSNGTFTVSRAGHIVSGQNSGQVNINATSPQAPMPIPIVNETTSTITLLP